MSGTQTFRVGQMVWDRGQNEFGDAKRGGMVVRVEADDDGETQVVVITQARPDPHDKRPSLMIRHHDGRRGTARPAYEDQGAAARLVRIPAADIDVALADHFRDSAKMLAHARMAIGAAFVAMHPDYDDEYARRQFLGVFHELVNEARSLLRERGAA